MSTNMVKTSHPFDSQARPLQQTIKTTTTTTTKTTNIADSGRSTGDEISSGGPDSPARHQETNDRETGEKNMTTTVKTVVAQAVTPPLRSATIRDEKIGGSSRVTSVGTIALQSGLTRLVVALLKDGEHLQLKVQQMRPALFEIGTTGNECSKYADEQQRLMASLSRLKQGPVDAWMEKYERLRSSSAGQQLIDRQEAVKGPAGRAPVYQSMLNNLHACWKALLNQLDIRSQLLAESAQFFTVCSQASESMDEAERFVQRARGELMQQDQKLTTGQVDSFREARLKLDRLNEQVRQLYAVAQRQQMRLITLIGSIVSGNLGDSRVDLLVGDGQALINFIRGYLENLDRKRLSLEGVLTSTSVDAHSISRQLTNRWLTNRQEEKVTSVSEQSKQNSALKSGLREITSFSDLNLMESWLSLKIEQLNSSLLSSLGGSVPDSKSILSKHEQILLECRTVKEASLQFRGRSIHAIKANEPLPTSSTGSDAEQEANLLERQRALSNKAQEVITILEARLMLLRRTIDFYSKAREASADIGRLANRLQIDNSLQSVQFVTSELELKDVSSVVASGATILSELQQLQLAQKHGQRPRIVNLALVNTGIRLLIDQLSQELAQLKTQLSQRRLVLMNEDASKMANNFANKCHQLQFWLHNHLRDFLDANEHISVTDSRQPNDFIERHEQVRQQVHSKTAEVEALLRSLPTLAANFESHSRDLAEDIQTASDELRRNWIQTTGCLEARLEFATHYAAILAAVKPISDLLDAQQGSGKYQPEVDANLHQLADQVDELALEATRRGLGSTELPLHTTSSGSRETQITDINKQQVVSHAKGLLMQLQKRHFALNKDRIMAENRERERRDISKQQTGSVQSLPLGNQLPPPKLVRPLKDKQVEPFGSVHLECETEPEEAQCQAEWFMGAMGRPIPIQVKHSTESDGYHHRLTIHHFSPQCCGNYFVRLTNGGARATTSQCRLKLLGIIEMQAQEGAAVRPEVTRNTKSTSKGVISSTSNIWTHNEPFRQHYGREQPVVSSSVEREGSTISRIIRGVDSRTGEQTPADDGLLRHSARLGDISETETETNITSSISREIETPSAKQKWQTSGNSSSQLNKIQSDSKYQTNNSSNRQQTTIIRVESAGSSQSGGRLSSPTYLDTGSRSISKSPFEGTPQPPIFVESLHDSFGDSCSSRSGLVCLVVGNPPPTIEWLHNDQLIASTKCPPASRATNASRDPNSGANPKTANLCKLTIETINPRTQGNYVCRASNRLGQTSTSLTLAHR